MANNFRHFKDHRLQFSTSHLPFICVPLLALTAERESKIPRTYLTRMLLLRKHTAAIPLYSVSRSACWYRSAGRGNAPRPITSVFTPSPVKHTPSAIFSL